MSVSTAAVAAPAYGQVLDNTPIAISRAFSGLGVISGQTRLNFQGVIARAGVNYHFNWGSAPVVARY